MKPFSVNQQLFSRLGATQSLSSLNTDIFADLQGGIQPTNVVEFYGCEGGGKTEMLIHLIASSILPKTWKDLTLHGCGVAVIFVDTDYHFQLLRLIRILEHRILKAIRTMQQENGIIATETLSCYHDKYQDFEQFVKSCLDRLYLVQCNSSLEMLASIASLEQLLSAKPEVAVMMIDSLGAFYWVDKSIGGESTTDQEQKQRRIVQLLSRYVKEFQLVLIATKQALFDGSSSDRGGHREYLCTTWQRLVKYRYTFERLGSHCSEPLFFANRILPKSSKALKFSIKDYGIEFVS